MSSFLDNTAGRTYTESDTRDLTPEVVASNDPDTVKASHCSGLLLANKFVSNFREDCVDIVCVTHSTFDEFKLSPHGRNGITIKDRSRGVYFTNLSFTRHGRECDIELGQFSNYWRPGAAPTSDIFFAGRGMVDGTPVKIRVWDAEDPEVTFPHVIERIPKWIWFPYFCFRYAQLRVENFVRRLRKLTPINTTNYLPGTLQLA